MKEIQNITEEMQLEKEWFKEAEKQTIETLPKFIDHVLNDYNHDYGTVVHAVSSCALAAAWAATHQEGITGFQAAYVMWDFIKQWEFESNKSGLKIIDYDNMLYPQYEERFDKVISENTFLALKKEAKNALKTRDASPEVKAHWENIANGVVPFGYKVERKSNAD